MLRRYQSFLGKLYILLDIAATTLALLAAWWIRFKTPLLPEYHHLSFAVYMSVLISALPSYVIGASMFGLYGTTRVSSLKTIALQTLKSVIVMALIVMSMLYFNKQVHYSRAVLLMFMGLSWGSTLAARLFLRYLLGVIRKRGLNRKYILIIGVTAATTRFLDQMKQHEELGYHVIGYLDMDAGMSNYLYEQTARVSETFTSVAATLETSLTVAKQRIMDMQIPLLGTFEELDRILMDNIVDQVVLTLPHEASILLNPLIAISESHGVHAILVPDFVDILPSKPRFEEFAGLPIVDTRYTPLDEAVNVFVKRAFDILFSLLVLMSLSPLYLLIAILIRATSTGPIIYSQERLGKNRRPFRMYKFRTMRHMSAGDVMDDEGWTVPHDPRRTPIGRLLRSTSMDELPQFFNVLRGDMSVIGPRPERPVFAHQFKEDIPRYMIKHRVRPGITGWAQVNGLRGDSSIADRIEYDLRYIEHWSFGWDMRIVGLTVVRGFRNRNAY